jgi:4-amino-4-deoxy-L-arabinose transferase-like glycosyltransferase
MSAMNRRVIWYLLLAVMILAALFRFWRLGDLPPGLYHDEAYNGLDALSLNQGKVFPQFYEGWELYAADAHAGQSAQETSFPLFFEGNYGREPLHVYLMALSVSLLGATPFAIRAVPAAAGVLAVLTTFLATRALLNSRSKCRKPRPTPGGDYLVPLLAALTMAILYPAVHFSRFGIRAMVFVPVEMMAVACFWWGVNRAARKPDLTGDGKTWLLFLLSGSLLGLGIYTFAASRLLPLVWIIFVPLWFWRDRTAFHCHWRQIAGMAGIAFLTALPLLLFFLRYPYYFVFRIAYVANKGKGAVEGKAWMTWLLNVGRVLRGLAWQGETHLRHNLPGRPYLDPIQAILFLLGLINTLRQLLQPRIQFLLIWFGVMLLPSILSGDAPHFGRLSGAAGPIAILVALGAVWLFGNLQGVMHRWLGANTGKKIAFVLILLLFAASALWTASDYFGRYAKHPDLAADFYLADWKMGQYAAGQGENIRLYLTPTQEELATILFALGNPDQLRNYDGRQGIIPAGVPGTASLYLVRPGDQNSLDALQTYFPDGLLGSAQEEFIPFSVKADAPRNRTKHITDISFDEKIKLVGWTAEWEDNRLLVTLAWQAESLMEKDYTAFVHLTDSEGRLLGQLDRPPAGYPTTDWQVDEIVVDRYTILLPAELAQGEEIGLSTGFYLLPTLEAVGETAVLEMFKFENQD